MSDDPPHTNRLAQETSPYLLQHQHNPVDWYPWGEEALRRSRDEHKPILLSVGYSSCHWCHVMERESFEDPATAAVMNAHFVCIKVDREERPDLDEIYMQATLALSGGRGGWPMNVFLTPELEPFYAGTYFPPVDRFGMPSWTTILKSIAKLWEEDERKVLEQAGELTQLLREATAETHAGAVAPALIERAVDELAEEFDPRFGGFGPAPKFPRAEAVGLLLRHHVWKGATRSLAMAGKTLECMARGGIYDQIGGGFARYSVDERWLVPHFEKMLYDNAALTKVYLQAYQATGEALFKAVASETLEYVLREMTSPEGGFYSATDADSEGVEGKFFVWTPGEVEAVVGPEAARRVCAWYDVTEAGNFEGRSILNTPRSAADVAQELGITPQELEATIADAAPKLYAARQERVPPGLDDKVLAAWNGLMIGAFADGARILDEPRFLAAASRAADFVLTTMVREDGGLLRSYRAGEARFPAYLEDYAYLSDALVDLYEAGGRRRYLAAATVLAERLLSDFAPEEGGAFYNTARDHEQLLIRYREGHDGAVPNPNAVAAMALARLSYHLDLPEMREAAQKAIEAYGQKLQRHPRAFCSSLAVVDFLTHGPVELALVGTPGEPDFDALWRAVNRRHLPNKVLAFDAGADAENHDALPRLPLLDGKHPVDGQAALFVCQDYACQAPITDPTQVAAALAK